MPAQTTNNTSLIRLDSAIITTPIAKAIKNLFEEYRKEGFDRYFKIRNYLRADASGKPLRLADILIGVNPDSKKIANYPSISVFVGERSSEWFAYRQTKDTIPIRIFCCIQNTENEQAETLMYDFADIASSILFRHPVLSFELATDDESGTSQYQIHRPSNSIPQISYGTMADGFLRAAQIDWQLEVLLAHDNMIFVD